MGRLQELSQPRTPGQVSEQNVHTRKHHRKQAIQARRQRCTLNTFVNNESSKKKDGKKTSESLKRVNARRRDAKNMHSLISPMRLPSKVPVLQMVTAGCNRATCLCVFVCLFALVCVCARVFSADTFKTLLRLKWPHLRAS